MAGRGVCPPCPGVSAATLPCFVVGCWFDSGRLVAFAFRRLGFSAVSFALVAFSADDLNIVY
nr:MAG TPA: hypothetical protein [Caudoviricetes sp.]